MQPVRLDPVSLIIIKPEQSVNPQKNKKKRSKVMRESDSKLKIHLKEKLSAKKASSSSPEKPKSRSHSRSHSRKKAASKSRSRSHSRERKEKMYHPIKLESPRRLGTGKDTRISSNRAIFQRMTPYYSKKQTTPAFASESKTIKELEHMETETKNTPLLNQLVKESILIRV